MTLSLPTPFLLSVTCFVFCFFIFKFPGRVIILHFFISHSHPSALCTRASAPSLHCAEPVKATRGTKRVGSLHASFQLTAPQHSTKLTTLPCNSLDFHKSKLSCFFPLTSLLTCLLCKVTFYPLFWALFLLLSTHKTSHTSFKSLLLLSSRLCSLTVHWMSLLAYHTCVSDLLFSLQTCIFLYIPLFCKWYHHPLSCSSQ